MLAKLAVLLLTSAVHGEWVEISQHQHRSPPSHRSPLDDPTAANNIYANYSTTERPWQRSGITRVPNFGSVKRVQLQSTEKDIFSIGVPSKISENQRYASFGPVRAPNINLKDNFELTNGKTNSNLEDITKDNWKKTNNESKMKNPLQHFNADEENLFSNNNPNKFQKYAPIPKTNKFQEIRLTHNRDYNADDKRNVDIKSSQSGSESGVDKTNEDIRRDFEDTENDHSTPSERKKNMNETFGNTTNKTPQIPNSLKLLTKHYDENTENRFKKKNLTVSNISEHRVESKTDHPIHNIEIDEIQNENKKTNPVEVIWKLMKLVTDNISKNTRRSFRSKVRYLESVRNNIIVNIAERIEQAWPDDAAPGAEGARRRRAARGHVEFPSSESALMTISFLTFAVFLIKLVLQVIHTYKNKTMMVTPAVVAAVGRAAAALKSQTHH